MKKIIVLAVIAFMLGGCVGQTVLNDSIGQLTKRNFQSKDYKVNPSSLFKITVDTLSDEKYIIKYTDERQGIITAQKIKDNMVIDMNAMIKSNTSGSNLRFNASMSKVSFFGGKNSAIDDQDYYKYLFTKVDKSIFLAKKLYGNGTGNYNYDYKYNAVDSYDFGRLNEYYAY